MTVIYTGIWLSLLVTFRMKNFRWCGMQNLSFHEQTSFHCCLGDWR